MNTILARMLMSFVAFVFLLAGIFAVTIVVTGKQKDDGLIVNGGIDTSMPQTFTITVLSVNDEPNFVAANPADVNEVLSKF